MRVASVTVTFNSVQLITRHISALLAQTQPLTEIVVVDNASVDGTPEVVRRRFPGVTIVEMADNEGVGGGYAAGIEYAVGKGFDWIWLFDQDSIPTPNALEQLLQTHSVLEETRVGALACLPINPESGRMYPGWFWRDRLVSVGPAAASQQHYFVDTVISSGTLLPRQTIETVGLPLREYFIDFVDHEYNLRIRRAGFSIVVVRSSVMHHWIGNPRVVRLPDRNRLWPEHSAARHYYIARNYVATVCYELLTPLAVIYLAYTLVKQVAGILMLDAHKLSKVRMVLKGIADGLARRLGKRVVPPAAYPRAAEAETSATSSLADRT